MGWHPIMSSAEQPILRTLRHGAHLTVAELLRAWL
jgi:hypothetical protein